MSDAHELTDCVIINGDLAIQLSGNSKLLLPLLLLLEIISFSITEIVSSYVYR